MKHIDEIKDILGELVRVSHEEVEVGIDKVDTEEMCKVVDMIKDLSQALYYLSVVHAMENGDPIKYDGVVEPEMRTMKMYE